MIRVPVRPYQTQQHQQDSPPKDQSQTPSRDLFSNNIDAPQEEQIDPMMWEQISSQYNQPSQQQQLQRGSAQPPSWKHFSNLSDPTKKEIIYSTMCKQIFSQYNQITTLQKITKADPEASQRYIKQNANELEEENKRLKQEIEQLRQSGNNDAQNQQSAAHDEQIQNMIKQLDQEKEQMREKYFSEQQESDQLIRLLALKIKQLQNDSSAQKIFPLQNGQKQLSKAECRFNQICQYMDKQ